MFEPQEIRSEHKDVIHDVLYDYYGQRIATCSSDQTVKVNSLIPILSTICNIYSYLFIIDMGSKRERGVDCFG